MMATVDGIKLTSYGMAVVEEEKTGIIADLHIGMEEISMITTRLQTEEMLERLERAIEENNIEKLVIAGDIKHGFGKSVRQEWGEIREFFNRLLSLVDVVVLKGNHDYYIENIVKDRTTVLEEYRFGNYVVSHGHKEVLRGDEILIIGNEHPVLTLKDEVGASARVRAYVWVGEKKVLIVPAFNPLTRGYDVRNLASSQLSPVLKKADMEKAEVYAINDEEVLYFGTIGDIKRELKR
ncbi:MAG: metallophosphoesterase [Methanobacteriota archaeon]|nr:MAG: metallophosphoesterase [Euryarchaeota archaeon]